MPYVFLGIFFFSGFSALLYQTVWQRLLTLFGGADVYSVTIIVAAFMAGLGLGNLAGGHLADRLGDRARLVAFASCEFGIGAFAAGSAWLYYDVLYGWFGPERLSGAGLAVVVFLVSLWPTFFMGMSLPIASRLLTSDADAPADWVPRLYGWNTAGAACGALFTVAVILRMVSLEDALWLGTGISLACGLAALLWWPAFGPSRPASTKASGLPTPRVPDLVAPPSGLRLWHWTMVYALSGFIALSLEIVWFRVLGVAIKSSAYTFGHLLAVYLACVGLGAIIANLRPLTRLNPVPAFFLMQALVPISAAMSATVFVYSVGHIAWLQPLFAYFGSYDSLGFAGYRQPMFYVLYGLLPVFLIGPSTLLMGMSFSLLQRAVQTDVRMLGRRVGWLQTANIVGALAGTLVTGVVLLDRFGSRGTLGGLVGAGAAFAWWFARDGRWRTAAGLLGASALTMATMPSAETFWARLHGTTEDTIIYGEDASGLTVLRRESLTDTRLFVNGLGQSWLPYGGLHTALGALPALIHPNPQRIAVIGLGSGDTVFAAGGRVETTRIDTIEMMRPQLDLLRRLRTRDGYAGLGRLLDDPRVGYHFTDGRMFLRASAERYDIIEADALRPSSANAGNLYSVEYFSLLGERLRPGGLAVSWAPTRRAFDGMLRAFPYVARFGTVVMGSRSPITVDRDAVEARMRHPFTAHHYATGGLDIEMLAGLWLAEGLELFGPDTDRSRLDVNRDLFPKDEFGVPLRRR